MIIARDDVILNRIKLTKRMTFDIIYLMLMKKDMTNLEISELLRAIAASYQLKGEEENKFKIVAYERAADATEHASSELKDLWDEGKLEDVPGIGKSIAEHLGELFRTGGSKHFEEVMKGLPKQMFDLMQVAGIGAKTAFKLTQRLNIGEKDPLSDLENAAKRGEIEVLEGFGKESQSEILKSLSEVKGRSKRLLLPYASEIAKEIIAWIIQNKSVARADPLGSLRRRASSVGDIDIAVASRNANEVLGHFTKYPKKQRVLEKGDRTASIMVPGDIRVDVMVETPEAYGALLQHFTGSKHHNIALREMALKRNLSLSDYGIYIKKGVNKILKKMSTEEEFYKFLEMEWIPPELREDMGEIKAAQEHTLPELVELSNVKADLQIHSDFDIETSHDLGLSSMEDHIEKANSMGYEYIAFTEHNPSHSKHNEKQIIDILKRKKEKVEQINSTLAESKKGSLKRVYNSLEIDILPDGRLPVPQRGMDLLDFALVSIHSSFKLARDVMTKRVLSALSQPKVKIFAHPTGRRLGEREGVDLNWEIIFEYCIKTNKFIEINADPMRLDLPDFLVREGVKRGVKFTLGTDAHHVDLMDNMQYGVSVARRGWATTSDILNCLTFEKFDKVLKSVGY